MNSGPRQKFCDDAFVYLGVLPHIQTGQVKAEHLHRFSEPIESIVGDGLVAETTQRGVDDSEIPLQLCRVGVRLESVVGAVGGQLPQYRQCGCAQSPADTANRTTVRLVGPECRIVAGGRRQQIEFGRDGHQPRRHRQFTL